jgi:HPr kinase/phosphorylase
MRKDKFRVLDLLEIDSQLKLLGLKCIAGKNGLDNEIVSKIINRPGLALGGYFHYFANDRIQVFGLGEAMFVQNAQYDDEFKNISDFFDYENPCCIFSDNNMPSDFFLGLANEKKVPILISKLSSADLVDKLFQILGDVFAKRETVHGVLVEVFGIGILILGKSGIGKSETALELIERGHRLVADDTIELKAIQSDTIIGKGTKVISHHMEIRGIGIINVKNLFGVGAIRNEKKIQLAIELEEWDSSKQYDRIGSEEKNTELAGIEVPYLLVPVRPGRNIPIIIETAAMNQRLKFMGINAAKEFNKELMNYLETEEIKNTFLTSE